MKKVVWVSDSSELWNHSHHYEPLIEDLTGFSLNENICSQTLKYMAKRLTDTPYQRRFRSKYSIYENEYLALVEKFKTQADKNGKIEVK